MSGPSRLHHYLFAHRETPGAFFRDPDELLASLGSGEGEALLHRVWTQLGHNLAGEGHSTLPPDGLRRRRTTIADREGVLVVLPPPAAPTECYFVLLLGGTETEGPRYFTLEQTINLGELTGESMAGGDAEAAVLCEWDAEGRHLNLGPAAPITLEAFEAMVERRLTGA